MSDAPELLRILDLVVRADRAWPGFSGCLCVGVQGSSRTRWWQVVLGESAVTSFPDALPAKPDAILILGEMEAGVLVETGVLPETSELLILIGDRDLFSRFNDRYMVKHNWLAARLRSSKKDGS